MTVSLALAPVVKRELDRGSKRWHSMHLYRPPFTCGQCHWKVFLWCVYCEGCMWCLEGEECVARKFKDRDESRWVLQKWEKEVEVGKILHPTQSHAKTTPYVTYTAEIVVYYWWLALTALSADWDVMGLAWFVCDSVWNGSSLPLGRRLVLAESWALRTLKAASIDMIDPCASLACGADI